MTYIDECDDCGAECAACGRRWCRAEVVSPGEASDLCVRCWETETPFDAAEERAEMDRREKEAS